MVTRVKRKKEKISEAPYTLGVEKITEYDPEQYLRSKWKETMRPDFSGMLLALVFGVLRVALFALTPSKYQRRQYGTIGVATRTP